MDINIGGYVDIDKFNPKLIFQAIERNASSLDRSIVFDVMNIKDKQSRNGYITIGDGEKLIEAYKLVQPIVDLQRNLSNYLMVPEICSELLFYDLSESEIFWLSRLRHFLAQHGYLTNKQFRVIKDIASAHCEWEALVSSFTTA